MFSKNYTQQLGTEDVSYLRKIKRETELEENKSNNPKLYFHIDQMRQAVFTTIWLSNFQSRLIGGEIGNYY
ncbi:MAG: hypothetical protein ACXAD7_09555 [Candidatus Kariarchaeaceae archaeon]|jgi:hypothetical protein